MLHATGTALLGVLLLAVLAAGQAVMRSRWRFWCRECGQLFQMPWYRLLFCRHVHEDWLLRCPHCGHPLGLYRRYAFKKCPFCGQPLDDNM